MQRHPRLVLILLLFLSLIATGCQVQAPEFKSVRNLEMLTLEDGNFLLKGHADFYNPNAIGLTVKEIDVNVMVNGEAVGSVKQLMEEKIPRKQDFTLPLEVHFPPKDLFKSVLGGLLNMAMGEDFEVQYQGHIRASAMGVSFKVPVKSKSKLKLNS